MKQIRREYILRVRLNYETNTKFPIPQIFYQMEFLSFSNVLTSNKQTIKKHGSDEIRTSAVITF